MVLGCEKVFLCFAGNMLVLETSPNLSLGLYPSFSTLGEGLLLICKWLSVDYSLRKICSRFSSDSRESVSSMERERMFARLMRSISCSLDGCLPKRFFKLTATSSFALPLASFFGEVRSGDELFSALDLNLSSFF